MKVIFIGGPASGKTTLGKQLATKWKLPFYDTDQWVETKAEQSIAQIFTTRGEPVFRALETQALKILLQHNDCIIATGGGVIENMENRLLLAKEMVVYLDVSVKMQLVRTLGDKTRPLLASVDKEKKLRELYERRDPLYRSVAKLILTADLQIVELLECIDAELDATFFSQKDG